MKHYNYTFRKARGKKTPATTPPILSTPFAGRAVDGSQYVDIVEEQEYADRRPTAEEQQPRFSYLKPRKN